MLQVKNKLNTMKAQSELSEERIRTFEHNLKVSKQHLETALLEKEGLLKKIESVEMQIINADKKRQDMLERCKSLESAITKNDTKRKELQDKELSDDNTIVKLEEKLKSAKDSFQENTIRCEEAEERLQSLNADSTKVRSKREQLTSHASKLEKEIDQKLLRLNAYEDFERKSSEEEIRRANELRLLEEYYRDAEERQEAGKVNITRLHRIVEQTEDEIETMQLRARAAKVELQNVITPLSKGDR